MGATAELAAPAVLADGHHTHDVAVLLAEQMHGAKSDGVIELHFLSGDGKVLTKLLVDAGFDGVHGVLAGGAGPLEIEAQTVRSVFGATLGGLRTKFLTQRLVHHVGGGVERAMAPRRSRSMFALTSAPTTSVPSVRRHWWTIRSLIGFCTSSTSSTAPSSDRISP